MAKQLDGFEWECLMHGQQKRYGDSIYKFRVRDTADPPRDRDTVLAFCKTSVYKAYSRADRPDWSSPTVHQCEQATRGNWIYLVRCEYTG